MTKFEQKKAAYYGAAEQIVQRVMQRMASGEQDGLPFVFLDEVALFTEDEDERHVLGFCGEQVFKQKYGIVILDGWKPDYNEYVRHLEDFKF